MEDLQGVQGCSRWFRMQRNQKGSPVGAGGLGALAVICDRDGCSLLTSGMYKADCCCMSPKLCAMFPGPGILRNALQDQLSWHSMEVGSRVWKGIHSAIGNTNNPVFVSGLG